ncbi:MAG: YceI family protein [Dokdonia sp.]|jgi:polyisoprenoid-binding protein YceI|nr:lipid-binding protein [Cytophagaceae bacterium]
MKKQLFKPLLIAAIAFGVISCGEKKNETEATEAKEAATAAATATKFNVDTQTSSIAWMGSKPTGTHNGTVDLSEGVVKVEGDKITGTFIIDMTSIEVQDLEGDQKANLESHLKGTAEGKEDDFFNVNKYPTAVFTVTGVNDMNGKKMMEGNLTMKGEKKNISFPVSYQIKGDMMELTSEPFTIDRTNWGIEFMSKSIVDDIKNGVISDDMQLTINLKANKA